MKREELIQAVKERKPLIWLMRDLVIPLELNRHIGFYSDVHMPNGEVVKGLGQIYSMHESFELATAADILRFPSYKGSVEQPTPFRLEGDALNKLMVFQVIGKDPLKTYVTGYIEGVNGIVAEGETIADVREKLHVLYAAKWAFDNGEPLKGSTEEPLTDDVRMLELLAFAETLFHIRKNSIATGISNQAMDECWKEVKKHIEKLRKRLSASPLEPLHETTEPTCIRFKIYNDGAARWVDPLSLEVYGKVHLIMLQNLLHGTTNSIEDIWQDYGMSDEDRDCLCYLELGEDSDDTEQHWYDYKIVKGLRSRLLPSNPESQITPVTEQITPPISQTTPAESPSNEWIPELDKARFWIKVKDMGYCWEWSGTKNHNGYGQFRVHENIVSAHRVSYQLIRGEIPEGMHVLHSCDNPACVKPDHLFIGTHQDNMTDMANKNRGKILGSSSKYKGVGYRQESGTWRAYYRANRKTKWIGTFPTELEAAKARDKYVLDNNIDAPLNLPSPPTTKD